MCVCVKERGVKGEGGEWITDVDRTNEPTQTRAIVNSDQTKPAKFQDQSDSIMYENWSKSQADGLNLARSKATGLEESTRMLQARRESFKMIKNPQESPEDILKQNPYWTT